MIVVDILHPVFVPSSPCPFPSSLWVALLLLTPLDKSLKEENYIKAAVKRECRETAWEVQIRSVKGSVGGRIV